MSDNESSLPSVPDIPEITDEPLKIIIVSPDGTVVTYDETGTIIDDDYETAYSLWLSENRALDKLFSNYSVSEALLFIIAFVAVFILFRSIFKRRKL